MIHDQHLTRQSSLQHTSFGIAQCLITQILKVVKKRYHQQHHHAKPHSTNQQLPPKPQRTYIIHTLRRRPEPLLPKRQRRKRQQLRLHARHPTGRTQQVQSIRRRQKTQRESSSRCTFSMRTTEIWSVR